MLERLGIGRFQAESVRRARTLYDQMRLTHPFHDACDQRMDGLDAGDDLVPFMRASQVRGESCHRKSSGCQKGFACCNHQKRSIAEGLIVM